MTTFTTAGSILEVSVGLPATHNQAGFDALSWTTVNDVVDLGEGYSRAYNPIDYSPISTREVQTRKGSYNSGSATLMYARNPSDAGQNLIRTAAKSDALHSFRLTLQDGSKLCFKALVMGDPITLGTIDNIVMQKSELKIQDGGVVEIAAP